jgi:hypothetical protein
MFSTPVRGTGNKKTTLNWWEYWIGHCWMTGWQSMRMTFRMWSDLMTSNYDGYALLKEDDPESECIDWFWASLNEDDVYPKEFLEYLQQLVDDIETGKEELIPMDEDFFERIKNLTDEVDDEETKDMV